MIEEYIGNLALEVIKDKATVAFDKKRLKSDLFEYVKKQKKYNETCQLADELDYQGLMVYIKDNLLEDASERMFNRNPYIRRRARDHVIAKAIDYAHAESKEAKKRVGQIVGFCLDAIRQFYIKHKPDSYTIVAQIVDEVNIDTEKTVRGSEERIIDKINEVELLFLKKTGPELSTNDDMNKIEATWQKFMGDISEKHPLYPHYGYGFMDNQIKSVPLTKEAAQKYPERVAIEGTVRTKNGKIIDSTDNPLDYSYRHQIPIFIDVSKATKFLGNTVDPRQGDVENMVGGTLVAYPPKFPAPIPCSIIVGTQTCYDYILLRIQEIKDDGIYVIGNKEQGLPFNITIYVNPADLKKPEFEISLVNPSNHDILKYVKFAYALGKEKTIHIHRLDTDKDWYAGNVGDIGYKSGFETIEEEIDFIERLCCIEDYYKVRLEPDGVISEKDHKLVMYISELIQKGEIQESWKERSFMGVLTPEKRKMILDAKNETYTLGCEETVKVQLFKTEINIKCYKTYKTAHFAEYDKLVQKLKLMEDGESIIIKLQPGDDNTSTVTLNIPENVLRVK